MLIATNVEKNVKDNEYLHNATEVLKWPDYIFVRNAFMSDESKIYPAQIQLLHCEDLNLPSYLVIQFPSCNVNQICGKIIVIIVISLYILT